MANISDDLADIAISRSLILQRVSNGLSKQVAEHYTAMIDDIQTTILKSGNISNRLRQTIKDIKEQLSVPNFDKDLKELAQQEVNYTQKAYNSVIGIDLFKNIPPEGAMSAILNTSLIEGATIHSWLKDLENSQAFDVERAVKLGMTLGETNAQLASRLKSTMELSMRNAQTIVRTATATVANQARTEFYDANDEVIKAWKWDATLDGRTRKEHADRDGALWDMNKDGINAKGKKYPFRYTPYGWNCRCQITPVLKSWQELGIDEEEVPVGTRSSLDGYVSQDMTFDKWLKTKSSEFQKEYLGAGRYELYSKGKITLSDLINQKGRYLSIKELKAMSGEAVAVAKAVKVPDISFGYGGKFDGYVKNIRAEAKMVINRLPKPNVISFTDNQNPNYNKLYGSLNILSDSEAKKHSSYMSSDFIFLHEYGHSLDYRMGLKANSKNNYAQGKLKDAFIKDKALNISIDEIRSKYTTQSKKGYYIPNGDFEASISDILDSLNSGKLKSRLKMHGHGQTYFKSDEMRSTENFANMFAVWSKGDRWDEMKKIIPNLSNEFEAIMREVLDGKFD